MLQKKTLGLVQSAHHLQQPLYVAARRQLHERRAPPQHRRRAARLAERGVGVGDALERCAQPLIIRAGLLANIQRSLVEPERLCSYGPSSYGQYSYGLYSYGRW